MPQDHRPHRLTKIEYVPRRLATAAGRITYQMFEPAWSHVVTSTLSATIWRNSQILGPSGNEVFYAKLTPAS